jgi:Leucine-rich repeat (LRR) protein
VSDFYDNLKDKIVDAGHDHVNVIYVTNSTLLKLPTRIFDVLPNLEKFYINQVDLMQIPRNDFQNAKQLQTLNVHKNRIEKLEDETFAQMKNLHEVDLSHNLITEINENTFKGIGDIYEIDLSFNRIKVLDFIVFVPLANKQKPFPPEVNLNHNEISEVKESKNVHHLAFQQLSLNNNQLTAFSCPDITIIDLKLNSNQLSSISMDNCSVDLLSVGYNNLKWLHLHSDLKGIKAENNSIKSFIVNQPSDMIYVRLSENEDISHIFPTLKTLKEMRFLNLSHSYIGVLQDESFDEMENLTYLHLRACGIQIIPFGVFSNNKNLKELDISANLLETVDLHMFSGLEKLNFLDISENKLRQIDGIEKVKDVLPELKEIHIDGNPWKCEHLSSLIRALNHLKIKITERVPKNIEVVNILGIPCYL